MKNIKMSLFRNKNIFKKNFVSVMHYSNEDILSLFSLADKFKKHRNKYNEKLINFNNEKSVGLLFFQPSTRTRMSFEIASKNLGLNTLLETNPEINLSIAKQETLSDTIRTISNYVDAIILRHPNENEVFTNIGDINVPIINAGWGNYEHPTQALIDLYTFKNKFDNLENTKMAIVGDPNTRTAKSVAKLANRFNMPVSFVYPRQYNFESINIPYERIITENMNEFQELIKNKDLIYYSNFTGTTLDEYRNNIFDTYCLPVSFLEKYNIHIYSPLPRRPNEMDLKADDTKYQLSFDGVNNSVYLRMALMNLLLNY